MPHHIDTRLVRGLGYYKHTVFEIEAVGADADVRLGAQQRTLLAGGRYDGLLGALGGPKHIAAFGWAAGIERLELLLFGDSSEESEFLALDRAEPLVAVCVARGKLAATAYSEQVECQASMAALALTSALRAGDINIVYEHYGSLKRQLQRADKAGAVVAIIVGEDELARNVVRLRNLKAGTETEHPNDSAELKNTLLTTVYGLDDVSSGDDALTDEFLTTLQSSTGNLFRIEAVPVDEDGEPIESPSKKD